MPLWYFQKDIIFQRKTRPVFSKIKTLNISTERTIDLYINLKGHICQGKVVEKILIRGPDLKIL